MEGQELIVNDKRMKESDIVPAQQEESTTNVVIMAMQKGYDPAFISQMMDLRDREEKYQAKKAYVAAMSRFKQNAPEIEKDRHVKYELKSGGTTEYSHASLANICKKVSPLLASEGLHASWYPNQADGVITVTCTITHDQGHSESVSLSAAPDNTGNKNSIQAVGSSISYLERYTFLALLGLSTTDMDNDGNSAGKQPEYISEHEKNQIVDMMSEVGMKEERLLKSFKLDSLDHLLHSKFDEAMKALQDALKKKQEKTNANN